MVPQALQLAVGKEHVSALRHHHALAAELFLETQCPAVSANAHQARGIEASEDILRSIADRDGLCKDLRGKNVQREIAFDMSVDGATVERDGQRVTCFQHGDVRGAADRDSSTFGEVDAREAQLHAYIDATAQQ